MAIAITAWKSYAVPIDQPTVQRFDTQKVVMTVTGAAADNDYDIGDLAAGAFWTSAEAHATHGAKATALKAYLGSVYPKSLFSVLTSPVLTQAGYVRVAGATGGATEYQVLTNATSKIPEILFHAASAPTAITIELEFNLKTGEWPVAPATYGAGV